MAGQQVWNDAGSTYSSYIVNPALEKKIYMKSTFATIFGKLNGPRMVKEQTIVGSGGAKMTIDQGNDSPIWEKDFTAGGNECRFTTRQKQTGMATYGDAPTKSGDFAKYMFSYVKVIQVDSPSYPVVGFESQMKVKDVIDDVVNAEKDVICLWRTEEN